MLGLYIHIPFCAKKCDYCDFYSLNYSKDIVEKYVEVVCNRLKSSDKVFDTVYLGGGTPSLIGANNLAKILNCVKYKQNAEISLEVNPKSYKKDFFDEIYKAGFNRVSIGMQSANDSELKILTRNHSFNDVKQTVELARKAGFDNISLDIMLGISLQNINSLKFTLEKALELNPEHLSCYMLKIEEKTPYFTRCDELKLPDDDEVSDMYLYMCKFLKDNGFEHYEISNFAKNNKKSRHNLIYWHCEEYLGLGPAAHSFVNGKRFYFPNDIDYFMNYNNDMIFDENGGNLEEKTMLGLRLNEGIEISNFDKKVLNKLNKYCNIGLANIINNRFVLNEKGFLVQNTILIDLLEELK